MPGSQPTDARRPAPDAAERDAGQRAADHAAIDRLSSELLPALVAKLGATGLGELEVREGAWRVRLRRPTGDSDQATGPAGRDRRAAERAHDRPTDRSERTTERSVRPLLHAAEEGAGRSDPRTIVTSPAVGTYRPAATLAVGERVRSGDRLGAVDMLGVAQEVAATIDGIVATILAEPGDAVEYGQGLLAIEPTATPLAPPLTSTNGTAG